MKKSFSIHSDFYAEIKNLPASERGDLLFALISWASGEEAHKLGAEAAILFRLMCNQIERIHERNLQNGAKGGRPKTQRTQETQTNPTVTNTVTNTVTVTNTNKFIRPTLGEIQEYCEERGNCISAERFLDHYESNGWKVGKNSMKDWKAAVRNWEKNGKSSTANGFGDGSNASAKSLASMTTKEKDYDEGW